MYNNLILTWIFSEKSRINYSFSLSLRLFLSSLMLSTMHINQSFSLVRNQYCPIVVIDCPTVKDRDNFNCITLSHLFSFSPVLFSALSWLFAIIIIFRHLPRGNFVACVPFPSSCILVAQLRSTEWMGYAKSR